MTSMVALVLLRKSDPKPSRPSGFDQYGGLVSKPSKSVSLGGSNQILHNVVQED